jgi:arginase
MTLDALVVPYDSGFRDARMGAGPARLLDGGVLDAARGARDHVNVQMYDASASDGSASPFRGEIASALHVQHWLAQHVTASRAAGHFPLVLSGNCIVSVGVCAGLRASAPRLGVCWFDAHGDFNTPEITESGFLDGMALAMLTGRCWTHAASSLPGFRPARDTAVVMFGTRSLDALERKALRASDVASPRSSKTAEPPRGSLARLRTRCDKVYLHIDLDALDAGEGRANSYACSGGFTRDRLLELVREIRSRFDVVAASLTAYDPTCDPEGRIPPIAREIVTTLLGRQDSNLQLPD